MYHMTDEHKKRRIKLQGKSYYGGREYYFREKETERLLKEIKEESIKDL